MPTRALPESYDVLYRYGNAHPAATAVLLDAYRAACSATEHAVSGLDTVAITMNAPTRVLAVARAAIRSAKDADERLKADAQDRPSRQQSAVPDPEPRHRPGSVEQAVRSVRSSDLILLMRARAIDKLAAKLIAEAKKLSQDVEMPGQVSRHGPLGPVGRNAARVAGENFPSGLHAVSAARHEANPLVRSAAVSGRPKAERP